MFNKTHSTSRFIVSSDDDDDGKLYLVKHKINSLIDSEAKKNFSLDSQIDETSKVSENDTGIKLTQHRHRQLIPLQKALLNGDKE